MEGVEEVATVEGEKERRNTKNEKIKKAGKVRYCLCLGKQ